MRHRIQRRRLLVSAASAAVGVTLLRDSRSARAYHANEKLNIAIIGAGGRGAANLSGVAGENIVALCDVDERRAGKSFEQFPEAARHHDYRKMLDRMNAQIEAVVVSTPNHVHAPASVTAMRMGKHAYCEKPLSHSVHESRTAARVAAENKLATQMGTQIHATANFRRIVELVQAGAIGRVSEFHCWLRGGGSAGDRPAETPPVPEGLDWNLWLGPAPYRPYHPCYVPHDWHYWWDFGGGAFGNMGCHYLDLGFWALGLRYPSVVQAEGPPPHAESTPRWEHVRYEFPAGDKGSPITLTWTHGREKTPPVFSENKLPDWAWGVFVGAKGMLLASYSKHLLWPEDKFADYKRPEPSIPPSVGHHQEWIDACKTGSPTTCNFDYSGAVTESLLLGNVAYRTGQKLQWDGPAMRVINHTEANALLQREYRDGWTL